MTSRLLLAVVVAACASLAAAQAPAKPAAIDDAAFGLGKGSVFDTATPKPFTLDGSGKRIAPPPATPPMIPHAIDAYVPLTVERNACLGCHDRPADIGRKVAAGAGRPAPATHYVLRDGKRVLSGAQYLCTGCHAPQAAVEPLIGTAGPGAR